MSATTGQVLKAFAYVDKLAKNLREKIISGKLVDLDWPAERIGTEYLSAVRTLSFYDHVATGLREIFKEEAAEADEPGMTPMVDDSKPGPDVELGD